MPIIVLTASALNENFRCCYAVDMDVHIAKLFQISALKNELQFIGKENKITAGHFAREIARRE